MVSTDIFLAALASNTLIWFIAQLIAVAFLVYLFLRWKPGFMGGRTVGQTMGSLLDARKERIQEQLNAAERSRAEAAKLREQAAADVAHARQEAEGIVSRAASTSDSIRHEIEVRAREEYERIVAQAKNEIQFERERAELALQRRAADIVIDAAEQVVARRLEPQSDRRIIDRSLSNLKEV